MSIKLNTVVVTEREVMTDLLKMYKELPCLWELNHQLYNNKEFRDEAFLLLLEKYKLIQDDANIESVKKKIENMRCCYKREYKKVLMSIAKGKKKYIPSLWYYKYLTFLDNTNDMSENESDEETEIYLYGEQPVKKAKLPNKYLNEEDNFSQSNEETQIAQDNNNVSESRGLITNEAESFGRTVGWQLNQLEPTQRYIAEKLISDVIYHARCDKLKYESNINLNLMPEE